MRIAPGLLAAIVLSGATTPLSAQERGGGEAFAIEAAGGAAGSLVGFGLGALMARGDCEGDDLECYLDAVGRVVLTASAGSTLGAWGLGKAAHTRPSFVGAAIGSLAGAFAGAGMLKVLEEIDPSLDDGAAAAIGFSVTQGVVTAIGSRIGAALR